MPSMIGGVERSDITFFLKGWLASRRALALLGLLKGEKPALLRYRNDGGRSAMAVPRLVFGVSLTVKSIWVVPKWSCSRGNQVLG
jgi:hypothetical protein